MPILFQACSFQNDSSHFRDGRRGQVLVLIACMAGVMIGLGGLAVDLVLAYSVKTVLATATDAAALGAIRALERGVTYSDQQAEIQRVAGMLFDANFPDNILLTGNSGNFSQSIKVAAKNMDPGAPAMFETDPAMKAGMREVRIKTIAEAPTFFMRYFGVNKVTVRSSAYAARRDVNVMVVLDRSASLKSANAWDDVQESAIKFIEKFDNNRDRLGLVTFGTGANVDFSLAKGFKTGNAVKNKILAQQVPSSAYTNYSTGLWLAYAELLRVQDADALNAIVFFTDGQPSAFSARFRMKTSGSSPRCSSSWVEGTVGAGQDASVWNNPRFYDVRGLWNRDANGPPVYYGSGSSSYDHPQHSSCSSWMDQWGADVELAFNSSYDWPTTWTATESGGISNTFCIDDNASGCEGDDGTFSYSRNDSRLYSNSSTTSNATFRGTNVHNGAKNLSLNIAQTARRDSTLGGVYIHAIGLGGYGYDADASFMKRMTNDPSNSYGVQIAAATNEPMGSYVYAPSLGELNAAFDKVRSEVMRLTR
ncbi:MAG: vWA domain-containing protein [Bryobacterales bacterium]